MDWLPNPERDGSAAPLQDATSPHQSSAKKSKRETPAQGQSCHTCRRRRLRCDATKPTCMKCDKRGVECLGYGAQPFLWVQPSDPAAVKQASTDAAVVEGSAASGQPKTGGKKKGRPKLVLLRKPVDDGAGNQATRQHTLQTPTGASRGGFDKYRDLRIMARQSKGPLTPGLVPAKYHESLLALRSLDYINNSIAPDMVLVDSHLNPHRANLEFWPYIPDVYMDLLICVAWTHQLVRSHSTRSISFRHDDRIHTANSIAVTRNRMASLPDSTVPKIYKRMQSSLKLLNEILDDSELRYSDVALSIIITLMRFEVQQSAFGAWPTHLHAARTIVKQRGGLAQVLGEIQPYIGKSYITGDVMAGLFTPRSMLDRNAVVSQLDYIPLLASFYQDGRDTDFPCPNEMVEALIRINHMRLPRPTKQGSSANSDSERSEILQLIASFNPQAWAQEQLRHVLPGCPTSGSTTVLDSSFDPAPATNVLPSTHDELNRACEEISRAFQYSTMLYCLRTLYMDQGDCFASAFTPNSKLHLPVQATAAVDALMMHQFALQGLLESLRALWAVDAGSPAFLAKLSLWPLWTAGMELDPGAGTAGERQFISVALQKLAASMGGLAPIDALSAVQLVWENTRLYAGSGRQATWDEKIMMPGMRGMFFF